MRPLNGDKTHPLTAHAISVLRDLAKGRIPAHRINPGVRNRLSREELGEIAYGASSFAMFRITEAGLERLRQIDGGKP